MSDILRIIELAAGSAAIVGVIGLLVLRLLRGRSLRAALFAIALASVLAMAAGTVGAAHAMFISTADFGTVLLVCASAGIVALVMAALLGERRRRQQGLAVRVAYARQQPRRNLREQGGTPPCARLATAEMAELSRELAATSMRLAESSRTGTCT